jgi:hypothetical protein
LPKKQLPPEKKKTLPPMIFWGQWFFFFFLWQICDHVTRRFSHIWLWTGYESRNLLKSFNILAICLNNGGRTMVIFEIKKKWRMFWKKPNIQ